MRTARRIVAKMLLLSLAPWGCQRGDPVSSNPQPPAKSTIQADLDGGSSTSEITSEEYAVYSAVLKKPRIVNGKRAQLLVIGADTAKPTIDEVRSAAVCQKDAYPGEPAFHRAPQLLSDEMKPLVDDLLAKNRRAYSFIGRFSSSRPHTLISDSDLDVFFKDGPFLGWELFYKKFPAAEGFRRLSRVGFDPEKKLALVYVATAYRAIDAFTTFVLLQGEHGNWSRVEAYTCNFGRAGLKPEVP